MNISRIEIIDGKEYIELDIAIDMLKEERKYKDNLIKYLEDKIKENQRLVCDVKEREIQDIYLAKIQSYEDILERVKSGKYE